jgi:hypothetical protein
MRDGHVQGRGEHYKDNKEFLEELSTDIGIPISGIIQIAKGGNDKNNQGTWVHPKYNFVTGDLFVLQRAANGARSTVHGARSTRRNGMNFKF